jgi:hypothetical protein
MRFLLPLLLLLASCREPSPPSETGGNALSIRIEAERPLMGTLFKVITHTPDAKKGYRAIEEALDLAEEFGKRATDYDPTSELNSLTKSPLGTPVTVSENLFQVLLLGQKLAKESNGIFDPTYGPLTHLWRESNRTRRVPSDQEIAAARLRCGIDFLIFNEAKQTITVTKENMQLDLGGIAKGFAADLIFDDLKKKGYPQTLVAAAGDLRIGAPPPRKKKAGTSASAPSASLPLAVSRLKTAPSPPPATSSKVSPQKGKPTPTSSTTALASVSRPAAPPPSSSHKPSSPIPSRRPPASPKTPNPFSKITLRPPSASFTKTTSSPPSPPASSRSNFPHSKFKIQNSKFKIQNWTFGV